MPKIFKLQHLLYFCLWYNITFLNLNQYKMNVIYKKQILSFFEKPSYYKIIFWQINILPGVI